MLGQMQSISLKLVQDLVKRQANSNKAEQVAKGDVVGVDVYLVRLRSE